MQIYKDGAYNDTYNSYGLLPLFNLEWLHAVGKILVDEHGQMSPANARRFMQMLQTREPVFAARLQLIERGQADLDKKAVPRLRQNYAELRRFLQQAVDNDEPITCSF